MFSWLEDSQRLPMSNGKISTSNATWRAQLPPPTKLSHSLERQRLAKPSCADAFSETANLSGLTGANTPPQKACGRTFHTNSNYPMRQRKPLARRRPRLCQVLYL